MTPELVGAAVRVLVVREVGVSAPIPPETPRVEFARAELPEMLERARPRLVGFRDGADNWALDQAPSAAERLAAATDRGPEISASGQRRALSRCSPPIRPRWTRRWRP